MQIDFKMFELGLIAGEIGLALLPYTNVTIQLGFHKKQIDAQISHYWGIFFAKFVFSSDIKYKIYLMDNKKIKSKVWGMCQELSNSKAASKW